MKKTCSTTSSQKLDNNILLLVSKSLGHNRISIIKDHYIKEK